MSDDERIFLELKNLIGKDVERRKKNLRKGKLERFWISSTEPLPSHYCIYKIILEEGDIIHVVPEGGKFGETYCKTAFILKNSLEKKDP